MAVSLKHTFTSNVADSGDATLVQPSNWNAEHNFTMATSRLLGRTTANTGSVEEISVAGNLTLSGGSLTGAEFPSGTRMIFQQTAAPTGWTKDTTAAYDNNALRIVTGSVTTGGTVDFTTAFTSARTVSVSVANTTVTGTVGGTTLTTAQMPTHTHTYTGGIQSNTTATGAADRVNNLTGTGTTGTSSSNGSSTSHTHSLTMDSHTHAASGTVNLAVKYIDFIIASKN